MKLKILLIAVALAATLSSAFAEDVPKLITDGLAAYKSGGFSEAFDVWLKNSPMESDGGTAASLKDNFTKIEAVYGKMTGYEILRVVKLSSSTVRVYAEMRYERGPIFMFMDCYRTNGGHIVPAMRFHTEADRVLPEDFFTSKSSSNGSKSR